MCDWCLLIRWVLRHATWRLWSPWHPMPSLSVNLTWPSTVHYLDLPCWTSKNLDCEVWTGWKNTGKQDWMRSRNIESPFYIPWCDLQIGRVIFLLWALHPCPDARARRQGSQRENLPCYWPPLPASLLWQTGQSDPLTTRGSTWELCFNPFRAKRDYNRGWSIILAYQTTVLLC